MQKCIRFFIVLLFSLTLTGCFSNPLSKFKSASDKVEATQDKKAKTEEKVSEKAKNYVFAADYALSKDPEPSKESKVAKEMTGLSLSVSGPPAMKDSLEFKSIVDGLLATNAAKIKLAEEQLNKKNQEVVGLQGQISVLQDKLGIAEKIKDKIAAENSGLANKWNTLTRIFWIIVYVACGAVVLHILSFIIPPPYNSVFSIISLLIGGFVKILMSLAPKAKDAANLVSKETHELSETTLKHLVGAIQEIRKDSNLVDKVDSVLKDFTSKETSRNKIIEVKKTLGHI